MGLSLVFPDDVANEEPVQRGVANNLNLPHYITTLAEALRVKRPLPGCFRSEQRMARPNVEPLATGLPPSG